MPSVVNQELVRAFNVILRHNEVAITNSTVQNVRRGLRNRDHIVISFGKDMDVGQCMDYLHSMKESIVETFCGSESGANMSFSTQFFPFNFNERELTKNKKGYKFSVPIGKGVVFNLKCLQAHGLAKDVKEAMGDEFGERYMEGRVYDVSFDRKSYLYCMQFCDEKLQGYFVRSLSSRIQNYKNGPKRTGDFLEVRNNSVYIKAGVFDDVKFIEDIVKHKASLECRDFEVPGSEDENVENLKFSIIALLRGMGAPANAILHVSYTGSGENSILVPIIRITSGIGGEEDCRLLNKEEVSYVNRAFGMDVLRNVQDYTSPTILPVFGNGGVYGIDFYDEDISYCVLNKIVESSVINEDHELSVGPELHLRAFSPAQSPFSRPTHAGPSGLRTPPNERKKGADSDYNSISPPSPESSGAQFSSGSPGPSTELSGVGLKSPAGGRGEELGSFPRQGLEEVLMLPLGTRGVPGTGKEFSPRAYVGSATVVSGSSSSVQSVGTVQNVQAGTSAWSQPINPWPSPASSAGLCSLPQSGPSSSKGASERRASDKPLTGGEIDLFKELLYAFNLNNYILECPNTNFIVKNGEIASLINGDVNVKEYLKELRGYIIKEYCDTEERAYDLVDEFPFKFLPNCEKNQETTVVANISSGALFNLKKLFAQEHKKGVKIEDVDINIVKKAVKSKKDEWVDSQVKQGIARPHEAITTCFSDESELEHIQIIKDRGGYCLDRTYSDKEVESFLKERRCAKGTSVAGKVKFEGNKGSGHSSGFLTDAERVSSEADAITSSGYESMDCENTRRGSPKRKSPEHLDGSSATKKTRSGSDSSSFEGGVGSPRPVLSASVLEQVHEQLKKTVISKW